MTTKVLKSTERGQITLPKIWRSHFCTNNFVVEMHEDKLIITPLDLDEAKEEILFDADRDNEGEGLSVSEMIRVLKKLRHG